MKCREVEKRIYLYTELTADEREETDRHVSQCAACSQIMERANDVRRFANAASRAIPTLPDAAVMTRRIMGAVRERRDEQTSLRLAFSHMAKGNALRYGMAALSLFLILGFITEYNQDFQHPIPQKVYRSATRSVELNTASFHQAFMKKKEQGNNGAAFLYECISTCLRTHGTVCADCGIKLSKLKQPS